jgi:hypothetical protein
VGVAVHGAVVVVGVHVGPQLQAER